MDPGEKQPLLGPEENQTDYQSRGENIELGATSSSTNQSESAVNTGYYDKLGVAFSGGGIRSAAFCSGVLRRLLTKNAEPDYLSCVSGGGYTGSAYVQWKYRRTGNSADFTKKFFDDMRRNAGYFCNYTCTRETCSEGLCGCVPLFFLLLFVAIIFPILGWGSLAIPIAVIIKLLYGQFLDGTKCRDNGDSKDCLERNLLFSLSLLFFLLFHFFEYCCKGCFKDKENCIKMKWAKLLLKLGQLICGATLAFTFGPWFINDFLEYSPWYIQGGIISITAVFWFFVPVLRKYSSLVILIYSYSYVVYWHLYEKKFLTIKYTKEIFGISFKISICLVALFSILGDVPLRMVHIYNRWRLKKAFYNNENVKEQCCYCYDLFPGGHCLPCCCATCMCPPKFPHQLRNDQRAVTLEDLKGKKPEYISNMVVNNWRREYDRQYCLLTMSSEGITVIDKQPQNNQRRTEPQQDLLDDDYFENILQPSDIKLSSAMAMSAAAVSPHLGKYKAEEQKLTHILTILNMEMAANVVYNMAGERLACQDYSCYKIVHVSCLYLANIIVAVVIAVGGVSLWEALEPHTNGLSVCVTGGVVGGILLLLLILLLIIYICSKSSCPPNCSVPSFSSCEFSLSRWFTVHLPVYRFLLSLLHFIHDGPKPPAMLHLSDGGHFENYGLLPLLKLRLPRILVADGSYIESNDDYAKEIIEVMELARELLGCSFTAMDGGDVLADIRNKYVYPQVVVGANPENVPPQKVYQRMYEFKVRYPDKGPFEVREGHIVLIAPRHQDDGEKSDDSVTWETEKENLNINDWGSGPILREEDISNFPATSSCCEKSLFRCCAKGSAFPRHSTANQFFTPHLFSIYHREGYRACMKCDDFLKPPNRTTRLHLI